MHISTEQSSPSLGPHGDCEPTDRPTACHAQAMPRTGRAAADTCCRRLSGYEWCRNARDPMNTWTSGLSSVPGAADPVARRGSEFRVQGGAGVRTCTSGLSSVPGAADPVARCCSVDGCRSTCGQSPVEPQTCLSPHVLATAGGCSLHGGARSKPTHAPRRLTPLALPERHSQAGMRRCYKAG
jgi:hypothetical protein